MVDCLGRVPCYRDIGLVDGLPSPLTVSVQLVVCEGVLEPDEAKVASTARWGVCSEGLTTNEIGPGRPELESVPSRPHLLASGPMRAGWVQHGRAGPASLAKVGPVSPMHGNAPGGPPTERDFSQIGQVRTAHCPACQCAPVLLAVALISHFFTNYPRSLPFATTSSRATADSPISPIFGV
jgi:hypothetical protein